ncbi:MAG: 30S ribosomal protein S16 [Chloroflexi bacterium]|nr:30S ribosomal protein S16 [Chloroflexota bacterium]
MLKIRLSRMGAHKRPFYRITVADAAAPREGRSVDILGYYNPLTDPETVAVNTERALLWLNRGAQPTEAVARLFSRQGIQHRLVVGPWSEMHQPTARVATQ